MTSTEQGLALATQLEKIGFVDFTVDLVRGVYEIIVTASMDQLNAYSHLVSQVSKDLSVYQAELIGAEDSKELSTSVDGAVKALGLEVAPAGDKYTLSEEQGASLKAEFSGIELAGSGGAAGRTIDQALTTSTGTTGGYEISKDDLRAFVETKLKAGVKQSQDLLKTVLKLGMQKVVVTNGEIMTKLTFHVDAEDTATTDKTTSTQKGSGWGVGGGLSASTGPIGKLLGGAIGLNIGGRYSNRKLNVSVVNEKSSHATNLQIDILGQVKIMFRTETFPAADL